MIAPPTRHSGCPAAADLEAHAAGELPELSPHVDGCSSCKPYVAALRDEAAAFVRARPPELFLKKLERRAQAPAPRPWWRWLAVLAPAAALVAVFLVTWQPPPDDDITLKGDLLRVFVKHGGDESRPLRWDEVVRAGDALRFSYDPPADGYLAIFDLDGTEAVTVFYPYRGTAPVLVKPGQGLLPGTVVLDAQPGPEWIVAVWSPTAFDTANVSAQLKGQSTRDVVGVLCEGCVVSMLRLSKPGSPRAP
jgi:hypothetical protein